jgi:dienelactone hydrolase
MRQRSFPGYGSVSPSSVAGWAMVVALASLALAVACTLGLPVNPAPRGDANGPAPQAAPQATVTPSLPATTPTVAPSPTPAPTATPDPRGSLLERGHLATFQREQINQVSARLYPAGTALPARYPVDRYVIRYASTDESGAPQEILAQLYVPRLDVPAALPVLVYGAGTTGLGDHCAPSREQPAVRNWGDYLAHMLSYSAQGYIAILPDYAGFNDESRLQRYFIADLESRVLLDAARAVYRFFEGESLLATPQRAVFFAGYSQGGHAAFAVRDVASKYAPEVPIRGAIGHGASTDLTALLRDSPYFAPYVLYALADYYGREGVDISRLLQPRWLATLDVDVTTKCIDAMASYYGNDPRQLYQPGFYDALFGGRLEQAFPALHQVLERNNAGLVSSSIPALVIQGTADPIVKLQSQDAFVAKLCAAGGRVTYVKYPNVHHFQTRQVGFKDTLAWMQTVLEGGTPPSVCAAS